MTLSILESTQFVKKGLSIMKNENRQKAQNYANEYNQIVALTKDDYFEKTYYSVNKEKYDLKVEEWIYPESIVGYICYIDTKEHSMTYPSLEAVEDKEQRFWCKECYLPCDKTILVGNDGVPVYRINIGIYSQICDSCGKLVVDGVKMSKDNKTPLCLFGITA